ncbi:hypothetical protein ACO2Q2_12045, partial [Dyella sp. KRB-257]|uniref:hypothetical protein n=1 Tax=Dyella sp. KRB-257 TaxID=3400915 RepID=UPI003BFB0BF8
MAKNLWGVQPDSVTRSEHSAPTTIERLIRAGVGDVHDTLSRWVAQCAQKVVVARGADDHFPRRSCPPRSRSP